MGVRVGASHSREPVHQQKHLCASNVECGGIIEGWGGYAHALILQILCVGGVLVYRINIYSN